jgi:hypothetical protein
VILQGSSSNLRHEYRFHADHFARAGFVVLTFDKRGKGESSGDYGTASYDDLVLDAVRAVELVRSRPSVDSMRVGIWGLSQGAFLAPWVAARVAKLAFIVAISPPGGPCSESIAYQDSLRVFAAGGSVTDAGQAAALHRRLSMWLQSGTGEARLAEDLARSARLAWNRATGLPARLPTGAVLEGWYWRGRTLDPLPAWRALRTPVLVVYGAADELVPASTSAERLRLALRAGSHPDATVRVFPAANHMIRRLPLAAGGAWDWPRAAPGFLDTVTAWMLAHVDVHAPEAVRSVR